MILLSAGERRGRIAWNYMGGTNLGQQCCTTNLQASAQQRECTNCIYCGDPRVRRRCAPTYHQPRLKPAFGDSPQQKYSQGGLYKTQTTSKTALSQAAVAPVIASTAARATVMITVPLLAFCGVLILALGVLNFVSAKFLRQHQKEGKFISIFCDSFCGIQFCGAAFS